MRRRQILLHAASLLLPFALLPACVVVAPEKVEEESEEKRGHRHGPPPWAPAHGYRRKLRRDNADLVFDTGLGVYVVVGLDDYFFLDDRFYRLQDETWAVAPALKGPWSAVEIDDLPPRLRKSKGKHGHGHGHERDEDDD